MNFFWVVRRQPKRVGVNKTFLDLKKRKTTLGPFFSVYSAYAIFKGLKEKSNMDNKALEFGKAILSQVDKSGTVKLGSDQKYVTQWLANDNVAALAEGLEMAFDAMNELNKNGEELELKEFFLYNAAFDDKGLAILAKGLELFRKSLKTLIFKYMPKVRKLTPLFLSGAFPSLKTIQFVECALSGNVISPEQCSNLPALKHFLVVRNHGNYSDSNFIFSNPAILLTAEALCKLPPDCEFHYGGTRVDVLPLDGAIFEMPIRQEPISIQEIMDQAGVSCGSKTKSARKGVREIKSALMYTKGNVGAAVRLLSS